MRDIAFLSCRFFSIYMLYEAVSYIFLAVFMELNSSNPSAEAIMLPGAMGLVSLFAFLLFWFKAELVSSKVIGNHITLEKSASIRLEDMQNVGFAVIGMLILTKAIPMLENTVMVLLLDIHPNSHDLVPHFIELSLQLVIGITLIFGADWFSRTIKKLRSY